MWEGKVICHQYGQEIRARSELEIDGNLGHINSLSTKSKMGICGINSLVEKTVIYRNKHIIRTLFHSGIYKEPWRQRQSNHIGVEGRGAGGYNFTKKEVTFKVYLEGWKREGYPRERRWMAL